MSRSPEQPEPITARMVKKIDSCSNGLKEYEIKQLVEDTESLGRKLARDLKTNQIRKFLDAVKRLKVQPEKNVDFNVAIKNGLQLLRPQLAYAAAKQPNVEGIKDLRLVMEAAIKKVNHPEDFTRFVQLIESIIAYHKVEGGRDQ
ncbi:MAG TPA: type III-A CRISPR-associated protein Csm2 [Oscillatoriales bacterium UBA8482]|nr:type III-A CRISPR-associated protein Csm2 [Oscillatoriales bacterium UBA8482]